ncbi:hypothetical protein LCGC14_1179310 [marine sediment metagenome]|uniref:Uncharacterized protein n=1 Tax=marine sediment metagenome TaxID=412755 RepID=A0A0F9MAG9_9ZZZZ
MTDDKSICFYFGCWNRPGHYLHRPGGASCRDYQEEQRLTHFGKGDHRHHLDGTLAPRKSNRTGKLCWIGQDDKDDSDHIRYRSEEYPEGQFLIHHLDNGFTAMQWWDRNQGDTRGACNSTILLKGEHAGGDMLMALHEHFPHVAENLKKAGIALDEVR